VWLKANGCSGFVPGAAIDVFVSASILENWVKLKCHFLGNFIWFVFSGLWDFWWVWGLTGFWGGDGEWSYFVSGVAVEKYSVGLKQATAIYKSFRLRLHSGLRQRGDRFAMVFFWHP